MSDNESQFRLALAMQVVKADFFEALWVCNPFVARLMLKKFGEFLEDTTFNTIERHSFLIGFLKSHKNSEIINYLLCILDNSTFKDEYSPIIMDWTFDNSESLIEKELDGPNAKKYSMHSEMKPIVRNFKKQKKRQRVLSKVLHAMEECKNSIKEE